MPRLNKQGECICKTCRITHILDCIMAKCDPLERQAINDIWAWFECAETELAWQQMKAETGETIWLGNKEYTVTPTGAFHSG